MGTQTLKITNIYKNTLRNPKLLHVVNVNVLELVLADISLSNNIARFRHPAALRNMGTLKFDPKLPKMAMLGLFDENIVNPNKKIREARFLEETSGSCSVLQESRTFFEIKAMARVFPSWDPGHPLESTVVVTRLVPKDDFDSDNFLFLFSKCSKPHLTISSRAGGHAVDRGCVCTRVPVHVSVYTRAQSVIPHAH